ncbi:DUF4386 family protein [Micromonospora inositola]|uniref:DUF4386 family protein n=1 Tax=Micromonospora inositola TaxID=47865 RepID=A0A1C5J619_9ACTN|nr:DUF4386 family protein [Micromonospora inositola]SCG65496.1 protein of unknown function [Micromonospora inositola]
MLSPVDRFRRRFTAAALVAGGVAILVFLATKTVNSGDEKDVLDSVAAHQQLNAVSSVAQLLMVALMLPALFGLLHLLRHRGARLAHLGVGLLLLNLVGNAVDVGHSSVVAGMVDDGVSSQDVAVMAATNSDPALVVAVLFTLLGLLGFPVLAASLWRSGAVARAIPVLMLFGMASFFVPLPEAIGGALLAAAFAWTGVRVLRAPDREWLDGWRACAPAAPAAEVKAA